MLNTIIEQVCKTISGADPGFLEKGFIRIKVWGVHFADFISFFHENEIIWSQ